MMVLECHMNQFIWRSLRSRVDIRKIYSRGVWLWMSKILINVKNKFIHSWKAGGESHLICVGHFSWYISQLVSFILMFTSSSVLQTSAFHLAWKMVWVSPDFQLPCLAKKYRENCVLRSPGTTSRTRFPEALLRSFLGPVTVDGEIEIQCLLGPRPCSSVTWGFEILGKWKSLGQNLLIQLERNTTSQN